MHRQESHHDDPAELEVTSYGGQHPIEDAKADEMLMKYGFFWKGIRSVRGHYIKKPSRTEPLLNIPKLSGLEGHEQYRKEMFPNDYNSPPI